MPTNPRKESRNSLIKVFACRLNMDGDAGAVFGSASHGSWGRSHGSWDRSHGSRARSHDGFKKLKEGGKIKLMIPSGLGYGDNGAPPKIPGGSTIGFDIELFSIK